MKDLVLKLIKYIRVFIHFKKINFLERLAFRSGFILLTSGVILNIFLNLIFIKVIYLWVTNIKGWNYYEALIIVGTSIIIEGAIWMTCAYLHALKLMLRMGDLDSYLVRPMDSQFLVSSYRGDLEDLVRIILGISIIFYGISHLAISGLNLLTNGILFIVLVINSYVILYSIAVIVNSISFWTIESPTTFVAFEAISRTAQYPADIFSGAVKLIFSSIIPIAFISTVPAKALAKGFDYQLVLGSFLVSFVFFCLARYVWKRGLQIYSSASS